MLRNAIVCAVVSAACTCLACGAAAPPVVPMPPPAPRTDAPPLPVVEKIRTFRALIESSEPGDSACLVNFAEAQVPLADLVWYRLLRRMNSRDAGFGAHHIGFSLWLGTSSVEVEVVTASDPTWQPTPVLAVRALHARLDDPHVGAAERAQILAAWGPNARSDASTVVYVWRDEAGLAALAERRAAQLGAPPSAEVPADLQGPYARLTSPFGESSVGVSEGIDGAHPEGVTDVAALLRAGRIDLLRRVLRGPNPEGRIYAAWALRRAQGEPLSPADAETISRVRASKHHVNVAEGCSSGRATPQKALEALEGREP